MKATSETAFVAGELYLRRGAWKFRAIGQGWDTGLAGLASAYGIADEDQPGRPLQPQRRWPCSLRRRRPLQKRCLGLPGKPQIRGRQGAFERTTLAINLTKGSGPARLTRPPLSPPRHHGSSATDYDLYALVVSRNGHVYHVARFGAC